LTFKHQSLQYLLKISNVSAMTYHHPFIIPLKMILIMWLKVHNTEQDFLMFKYMINIIWYGSFRILFTVTSCINLRPISSLELKLSGWYWCLRLIRDVIRKEPYNIIYISIRFKWDIIPINQSYIWNISVDHSSISSYLYLFNCLK
jgi:hypothetical protein